LLDIEMPGMDGIAAASALRSALPTCRRHRDHVRATRVLTRAMRAGAAGFVVKDTPAAQLDAVRAWRRAAAWSTRRSRPTRSPRASR
jgi:two-component system response regulator DesR